MIRHVIDDLERSFGDTDEEQINDFFEETNLKNVFF